MNGDIPYVIPAPEPGLDLPEWGAGHREELEQLLRQHGALLFRGFLIEGYDDLARFVEVTSEGWSAYREPATPRTRVGDNIFTSTEYPADQRIPMHNENSHCTSWPLKIYFLCSKPPGSGGQTPIVDCRRVLASLPPAVVDEFVARKWRYVRHFGTLGFKWQTVFGTSDKSEVEAYCRENDMTFEWGGDGSLTVTYVRDALRHHPVTGETVWFNHGLFFNSISLPPETRKMLLSQVREEELPYNTFFGDGGAIPTDTLMEIQRAYDVNTRQFDWQRGDVLMLDNMLVAHGRNPFTGERRILVGMADSVGLPETA
jgi:alpha-ketoglutarate-dependent taurine dioxygenase